MADRFLTASTPFLRFVLRLLLGLPSVLVERLTATQPPEAGRLAPDQRLIARLSAAIGAEDIDGIPVEVQRQQTDGLADLVGVVDRVSGRPLTVTEHAVSGAEGPLRVRLYRTRPPVPEAGPRPLLIWFHGGGWVVGSVASHDPSLRRLARRSGVAIATVEYRLAPESPWPAAPDDALAAWRDIRARAGEFGTAPGMMMVGGDSAGGNLAAVLCLDLKAASEPQPAFQFLLYPATDLAVEAPSYEQFARGFFLSRDKVRFYRDAYAPDPDTRSNPRVSPLRASSLKELAPAWVGVSPTDPLLDEGRAYAAALAEAGVPVREESSPAIHGWFNLTVSRTSRQGLDSLAREIASVSTRFARTA